MVSSNTNSDNNVIEKHGANLNLVAPSDTYSLNAPYASYGSAYSVLAHGPTNKGEMFIYSRNDCRDDSCSRISPHDLATYIKNDPQYHEGQQVALFICNAGKWGGASYAQALAKEMGAEVIAPTEVITAISFGTKEDYFFNDWVIAKNIKEVNPEKPAFTIMGHPIFDRIDKVVADPDGKLKYLRIDSPGSFTTFSPEPESKVDTLKSDAITHMGAVSDPGRLELLTSEQKLIVIAQFVKTFPKSQQHPIQTQLADIANERDINLTGLSLGSVEIERNA